MFRERIAPSLKRILGGLNGGPPSNSQLIIGGNTVQILDAMSSLSPSYIICPVETDQGKFMSQLGDNQPMTIRINMDPSVFLPGNAAAAMIEAKRVLDLAQRFSNTSTGTLIPFDADPPIINEVAGFMRG
ncbi:MAG: hypothetical protein ACC661_04020 [Verrucomicrobiales bacterium]